MSRTVNPEMRLLGATLRPERRQTFAVVGVLLVAMLLRLATPALLGRFVDIAIEGGTLDSLTAVAVGYVAAALSAELLQLGVVWASVQLSWRAGNRLRERLAHHALRLDMAWHGKHGPGQLIERIDGDVEALVVFFANVVIHVLGNIALVIGMLIVAFFIDATAAVVLLVTAIVGTAVMVRLRQAAVPAREHEREINAQLYGDLEERLGGLEDLRANGAGEYAVHRLHTHSSRSWRAARRAALLGDSSYAVAAITFSVGSVAILATGAILHGRGAITAGAVLSLFRYSEMLRAPLERIAEQMKEFQKALAGARRATKMLATESAIVDGTLGDDALPDGALGVEFDGVTFAYDSTSVPALRDVTLTIAPGTHVGVVGRTGSGKTTIGRLILRLWDAQDGEVRVGGVDVRTLKRDALRRRVAVVTQDVELFSASVRDNLTLFGTWPATDAELHAVMADVGLSTWLNALPDGLESMLEGGRSLSAGEAQLLAFARAFLSAPDLVVLDEASSRLDPVTEARLTAAMHRLLEGRTAIVIAHRLATLDEVDEIVVVEHGHVAEHGSRDALAADPSSRFAHLLAVAGHGQTLDEALA
ncbi:MAG: ABC transporter ATP-binding protein [Acidimicrobiia bacterium]